MESLEIAHWTLVAAVEDPGRGCGGGTRGHNGVLQAARLSFLEIPNCHLQLAELPNLNTSHSKLLGSAEQLLE